MGSLRWDRTGREQLSGEEAMAGERRGQLGRREVPAQRYQTETNNSTKGTHTHTHTTHTPEPGFGGQEEK